LVIELDEDPRNRLSIWFCFMLEGIKKNSRKLVDLGHINILRVSTVPARCQVAKVWPGQVGDVGGACGGVALDLVPWVVLSRQ